MDPTTDPIVDQTAPPPVEPTTPTAPVVDAAADPARKPVQPRIDELTRERHEAQRERDYWRTRAEAAEVPAPAEAPAKPKAVDFDDYGAFVEALADWKADQKIDAKLAERDTRTAAQKQGEERVSNWQTRVEKVRAAIPTYDEVMSTSTVPVSKIVEAELLDDERGPEIAMHLTLHPEIADKLNRMDQRTAAREIGRLSGSLPAMTPTTAPVDVDAAADAVDTPASPPAVPPRKSTSAPPPPKPVGAGRSTVVPLDKLSMDDYVERRKQQGASWARH